MKDLILVIPAKADIERDAVARVWEKNGGQVLRLDRFWEPPALNPETVRLYGSDSFCLVLAQILHLKLLSPNDDLIFQLPEKWVGRKIFASTLGQARSLGFPCFIKSLTPKLFKADIYSDLRALEAASKDLPPETAILCSEIIRIQAEARTFISNGKVLTAAIYEGNHRTELSATAKDFAQQLLDENSQHFPSTCVVDVALKETGQWMFLEANATWGAGLNGCDPEAAAQCIAQATTVA